VTLTVGLAYAPNMIDSSRMERSEGTTVDPVALEVRGRALSVRVRALLSGEDGGFASDELGRELRTVAGELRSVLGAGGVERAAAARLCELLVEVTEVGQDLRERAVLQRFNALRPIHEKLAALRELSTPADLIDAVPRALCECCGFDRAMISRIQGSTWLFENLYIAAGASDPVNEALGERLHGVKLPLSRTLMETELIRRKAPALVTESLNDLSAFHPLMTVARSRGYVAAPVMPTGRVIGFLHADAYTSGRPLTVADRDSLWTFAEGFGLIFERAVLLQRLDEQRAQVHSMFASTGAFIDELWSAEVRLARNEPNPISVAEGATAMLSMPRESRISALLTRRERDVVELMVTGATNGTIAERLVISEGTVKSHVQSVLRKLHVSNRAEAVSRYLHLRMLDRK
jgi:LuxR family transcriptional regulator, regulator of acetate metabolism